MYAIKCVSGVQRLQPSKIRIYFMKFDFKYFLRWTHKSKISYFLWHSFSWSPTAQFFQWPGVHVHLLDLVRVPGRRILRESGRQHGAGPQGEDTLRDSGGSRLSNRVQVGLRIGDLLGFCAPGISSILILIVPNSSLYYFIFFFPFLTLGFEFYTSQILQKSNIEVYQKIYQGARQFATEDKEVLSISGDIHFRKLMTEKYVFISPVPHLQTVSFSDCRSLLSTERFVEDNSAFGVPEDSPLKEIFSLK